MRETLIFILIAALMLFVLIFFDILLGLSYNDIVRNIFKPFQVMEPYEALFMLFFLIFTIKKPYNKLVSLFRK
ncbi:hypothetical protein BKP37_15635 [Anaerobacillus alkalilacustris]|uniref:Uncharacterized protein n=1 Tax=Anaerobacillus alkalilacustris TaxID=393763 RepID=A0A1S2LG12_9BACI|nr:hypothetical protein BKP37_15635 [Anaerobacillus alkalilacustris]